MQKAVALKYHSGLPAPFILARGKGEMAARLKQIARDNGISLIKEPRLTDALIEWDPGDFIPEEFYQIVAEILIFVKNMQDD